MNAGPWPLGEGRPDAPPLALQTGEPELRGVSGIPCLALIFYSFLLIIGDTDL